MSKYLIRIALLIQQFICRKCRYFDPFKVYFNSSIGVHNVCIVYVHCLMSNYTSTLTLLVACTREVYT